MTRVAVPRHTRRRGCPGTGRSIGGKDGDDDARRGLHYSACHELEIRWAELIRACVPGAERVRFTMTGTETTSLAIRVARAFTGRQQIIKFRGHFHGIHDHAVAAVKEPFEIPMSAGVPEDTLRTTLVGRHNDLAPLAMLLNGVDYNRGSANGWLNGAMTDADIDGMVDAFARSLEWLSREGLLG
ncbi:MAG: aminotransferase class III-fold pyridoxal phosphate-dependent enzyme [Candidatus Rokuibacteriota bacterium]